MIGPFELLITMVFLVITIPGTIFWIWMLVDCATKEPEGIDKMVWIVIILFTHLLGAFLYLIVRRSKRIAEIGK